MTSHAEGADGSSKAASGFLAPKRPGQSYEGKLDDLPENWVDLSRSEPKVKPLYRNVVPQEQPIDAQGRPVDRDNATGSIRVSFDFV